MNYQPKPDTKGESRDCRQCRKSFLRDHYSSNQWRKGNGVSRCKDCVSLCTDSIGFEDTKSAKSRKQQGSFIRDLLEREQLLEEKRVQEAVSKWKRTAPERNIDDENLECPICLEDLPLDGTTRYSTDGPGHRTGEPVYHTRVFCCGKRFCNPCENKFAMHCITERIQRACPLCRTPTKETALAEWLHHAEQGKSWAQAHVGNMYKYGRGAPKDFLKALSWHHRAAEKGNLDSLMALAEMHMMGEGVRKSMEEAKKWFEAGAERGDDAAQFFCGSLTKDKPTKIRYWTLASAQGHTSAQCALGKLIAEEPRLVHSEAPLPRAIYWFEKAAKQGDQEAQYYFQIYMRALHTIGSY
jgi:hypothetical protein